MSPLRHIWLVLLIPILLEAAVQWHRARREIAKNPAVELGYRRLILGWLILQAIPLLILGAAFELPSLWGTLLVVCFATACAQSMAGFYWVFFGGGAEKLAAHPGLLQESSNDPQTIKAHASCGALVTTVMFVGICGFFLLGGHLPR